MKTYNDSDVPHEFDLLCWRLRECPPHERHVRTVIGLALLALSALGLG